MNPDTASKTAIATALMRALHARVDAHRILDDPWGDRLVPMAAREAAYQMLRSRRPDLPAEADAGTQQKAVDASLRANAAYPNVILRSRYTDDALQRALSRGVRQVVLLGAGFDSTALRLAPAPHEVTVVEIDHPATQALKRRCVEAAGVPWPATARFVAADLAAEDLPAVLRRSSLRLAEPIFFSWLGVTMYLSREANLATLRAIASTAAPGSDLVFTYVDQARFDAPPQALSEAERKLHREVASAGEPFVSGFHPAGLSAELAALGLRVVEDHTEVELLHRYDPQAINGFVVRDSSRIVYAVTGR